MFKNDESFQAAQAAVTAEPVADKPAETKPEQSADTADQRHGSDKADAGQTAKDQTTADKPETQASNKQSDEFGPVPHKRFKSVLDTNRQLREQLRDYEAVKNEIAELRKQIAAKPAANADDDWMKQYEDPEQSAPDPQQELTELLREERKQRLALQEKQANSEAQQADAQGMADTEKVIAELVEDGVPEEFVIDALIHHYQPDEVLNLYRQATRGLTKSAPAAAKPLSRIGAPLTNTQPAPTRRPTMQDAHDALWAAQGLRAPQRRGA